MSPSQNKESTEMSAPQFLHYMRIVHGRSAASVAKCAGLSRSVLSRLPSRERMQKTNFVSIANCLGLLDFLPVFFPSPEAKPKHSIIQIADASYKFERVLRSIKDKNEDKDTRSKLIENCQDAEIIYRQFRGLPPYLSHQEALTKGFPNLLADEDDFVEFPSLLYLSIPFHYVLFEFPSHYQDLFLATAYVDALNAGSAHVNAKEVLDAMNPLLSKMIDAFDTGLVDYLISSLTSGINLQSQRFVKALVKSTANQRLLKNTSNQTPPTPNDKQKAREMLTDFSKAILFEDNKDRLLTQMALLGIIRLMDPRDLKTLHDIGDALLFRQDVDGNRYPELE